MGIVDAHEAILKPVRHEVRPNDLRGWRLAIDVASPKLKAFYGDAASYFREDEDTTHGYRSSLTKFISGLGQATGSTDNLVVVLDGDRFPPKAQEHAPRGS